MPVLGEYGGLGYAVEGHQWSSTAWGYGEKEVNRDPAAGLGNSDDFYHPLPHFKLRLNGLKSEDTQDSHFRHGLRVSYTFFQVNHWVPNEVCRLMFRSVRSRPKKDSIGQQELTGCDSYSIIQHQDIVDLWS